MLIEQGMVVRYVAGKAKGLMTVSQVFQMHDKTYYSCFWWEGKRYQERAFTEKELEIVNMEFFKKWALIEVQKMLIKGWEEQIKSVPSFCGVVEKVVNGRKE